MTDKDDAATSTSSAVLIAEAKRERQRLLEQIELSQKTIEHSREIIARIDGVLSAVEKNSESRT
jgi:hypothetical protein